MEKANYNEFLKENKGYKTLKRCEDTTIIRLPNGDILKKLDTKLLSILENTGYNLETRLNEVDKLDKTINFAFPIMMLEDEGIVNSYTEPYIPGIDFTDYYENIFDLHSYANIHSQIENNIRGGNSTGIVFPDLCTTENIRITPDNKVFFIDYDGLQIKKMPAVGFSDFLGSPYQVLSSSKYYDNQTCLFTEELDKKSAIFLYFVDVFGVDLGVVNMINPVTRKIVTLDDIFSEIDLKDDNIKHKVWKLFEPNEKNEFLGNDIYELAEKYKLVLPFRNAPIKKLVRK